MGPEKVLLATVVKIIGTLKMRAECATRRTRQFDATHGGLDLWQIEQQDLGRVRMRGDGEGRRVFDRCAVAGAQPLAVQIETAAYHLKPGFAAGFERVRHLLTFFNNRSEDRRVLVDRERAVTAIGRDDQPQLSLFLARGEILLFIAGLQPFLLGHQPDLQEMNRRGLRVIELAVVNAGARRHALHIARADDRARADAVFVLQRAVEDIRDNLHVAMAMSVEAAARAHPVFVDHAQRTETHVLRVVIMAERKAVAAVQPTEIGKAAFRERGTRVISIDTTDREVTSTVGECADKLRSAGLRI